MVIPGEVWVALAAVGGTILGNLSKWLAASSMTAKMFWQGILSGIIAAIVFTIAYKLSGTLTFYDLFAAVVGGWGAVMGQSSIAQHLAAKKTAKKS